MMGGYGSGGRHDGYFSKSTCEEAREIDIRGIKQRGGLIPGASFSYDWVNNRREPSGNIGIEVIEGDIILVYRVTNDRTKEEKDFKYSVQLDYTNCNYGGRRVWLRCPVCYKRVALIYMDYRDNKFKCRGCANLNYRSSGENHDIFYMLDSRIKRIRKRLNVLDGNIADYPYWVDKPENMHHKTFEQLKSKLDMLYEYREMAFLNGMVRLLKS